MSVEWHKSIDSRIVKSLTNRLKWHTPTYLQNVVLNEIANNQHDVLLQAKPGSGKTGAFLVPAINAFVNWNVDNDSTDSNHLQSNDYSPFALILEPSRELCYQASQVCREMTKSIPNFTVLDTATTTLHEDVQNTLLRKPTFIISTPFRLLPFLKSGHLNLNHLKYLIIDEADMLYTLGYRNEMKELKLFLPKNHTTLLATATLSDNVTNLKQDFLQKTIKICMKEDDTNFSENLLQYKINCSQDSKYTIFYAILKLRLITGKTLVFVNSINQCYKLKIFLEQFGISSCIVNPELPLNSRLHALEEFNKGKYSILIASDMSLTDMKNLKGVSLDSETDDQNGNAHEIDQEFSASRGIDFQGVKNIINFDCPLSVDSYIHRVGRTARFESRGYALTFVTDHEINAAECKLGNKASGAPKGSAAIFAEINEATDNRIKNFNFKMEDIDAMRYRCNDTVKKVTKQVIKKYRIKEIKLQILNSEKLKEYFESHSGDRALLRKQIRKPVIKKLPHLEFVPDYLVPKFRSKNPNSNRKPSNRKISTKSKDNDKSKTFHASVISKSKKKTSKKVKKSKTVQNKK